MQPRSKRECREARLALAMGDKYVDLLRKIIPEGLKNIFKCAFCERLFSKTAHLRRHQFGGCIQIGEHNETERSLQRIILAIKDDVKTHGVESCEAYEALRHFFGFHHMKNYMGGKINCTEIKPKMPVD